MKQYIEVSFSVSNLQSDVRDWVASELMEAGFEGVVEEGNDIKAYIEELLFSLTEFNEFSIWQSIGFKPSIHISPVENKNWNEEWEKNYFQPLVIGNYVAIRAPFHQEYPDVKHVLTIEPRMSFGTGHHDTTYQMMENLMGMRLHGKRILDMGCGTGVLAILATKLGANDIVAIDNDNWAYQNSIDNARMNDTPNIEFSLGDASHLENLPAFDIILANINRNIIIADLPLYTQVLKPGGELIISGFYEIDIPRIFVETDSLGYKLITKKVRNNWACLHFLLN